VSDSNLTRREPVTPNVEGDQPRPLIEHLEDLRTRIIYSIVFLTLGTIVGFFITDLFLFKLLFSPIQAIPSITVQVLGPIDKLMAYFKAAFIAGVTIAVPFIMHQIWLFVRPGLRPSERNAIVILIPASLILFIAGAAFVFYVLIPPSLNFLLNINLGVDIKTNIALDQYFSFILYFVLAGGLIFQIPLITWFLAKIGLVTAKMMSRSRKAAILVTAILAAVITPTGDPFNFMLLALPIYGLFEISILVAMVAEKSRASGVR
jgi:sec-independent protein translocase protein TatC